MIATKDITPNNSWDGHINEAGLGIIKAFEGFAPTPYLCPANRWTIGFGSTWDSKGRAVTGSHLPVTRDEAGRLLAREVRHVESAINKLVKSELTENMFSAIASLVYNIGTGNFQRSTLKMKLNRGEYENAADEFPKWRKAGGRILKGLVRRRAQERELFLTDV
jgi:lysozyme